MLYTPWNSNMCFHVLKFAFQVVFSAFPGKAIPVFMNEIFLNFRVREVTQILPPYTNSKHHSISSECINSPRWRSFPTQEGSESWSYMVDTR